MSSQANEPPLFSNNILEIRRSRFGMMAYLLHDIYVGNAIAQYGEYSYAEYDLFRQVIHPGDTVVDVGANIGAHTLAMAQLVGQQGKVLAFEPQPVVREILAMNVVLNQATQVTVHQSPLSASFQKMYMPALDYTKRHNFGDVSVSLQPAPVIVFATRLDDYELAACHFIKIDVQGAEQDVLLGAQATIRRCRPLLYVENDQISRSQALITTLLELDYRLFWHFPPLFNPNNYFNNAHNLFGNIVSSNMLCLPSELPYQIDMLPVTGPEDNHERALLRRAQAADQK